jgi:TatA/E family protein of Tat protein translocase
MLILVITLVFGAKNLPSIGQSLGTALRQFKQSINGGIVEEQEDEMHQR